MTACPACLSNDVIVFTLRPAGHPLRLRCCRSCEHRWWENCDSGDEIVLSDVLDRIATA